MEHEADLGLGFHMLQQRHGTFPMHPLSAGNIRIDAAATIVVAWTVVGTTAVVAATPSQSSTATATAAAASSVRGGASRVDAGTTTS